MDKELQEILEAKKTIREWLNEYVMHIFGKYCTVKIIDPDGFDRSPDRDLWKEKYTREEFEQGLIFSTLMFIPLKGEAESGRKRYIG